ncbi:hypothetical protein Goklo_001991 [Gossypium klotzschianum]|uniref:Uncharacterized protein n=2 Tax=Gossypium TaxID=3633 RepID=A0A7J8W2N0_9ROSI|nr:hypothetical protein [Gossypium klotzschianum]
MLVDIPVMKKSEKSTLRASQLQDFCRRKKNAELIENNRILYLKLLGTCKYVLNLLLFLMIQLQAKEIVDTNFGYGGRRQLTERWSINGIVMKVTWFWWEGVELLGLFYRGPSLYHERATCHNVTESR